MSSSNRHDEAPLPQISCHDFKKLLSTSGSRLLVIDCRPFFLFGHAHVLSAEFQRAPAVSVKKLRVASVAVAVPCGSGSGGVACSLQHVIPSQMCRDKFTTGKYSHIVIYDELGAAATTLAAGTSSCCWDTDVGAAITTLQQHRHSSGKAPGVNISYLQGGFQEFHRVYPQYCTSLSPLRNVHGSTGSRSSALSASFNSGSMSCSVTSPGGDPLSQSHGSGSSRLRLPLSLSLDHGLQGGGSSYKVSGSRVMGGSVTAPPACTSALPPLEANAIAGVKRSLSDDGQIMQPSKLMRHHENVQSECREAVAGIVERVAAGAGGVGAGAVGVGAGAAGEVRPVEILPHLYLGSAYHSAQQQVLQELGITAVLNVSTTCPNHFQQQGLFSYKCIPIEDNNSADISSWFHDAIAFIDGVAAHRGKVLVHCQAGISRSATICLAYLIVNHRLRLDEAFEYVRSRRNVISPNFNFLGQLLALETQVFKVVTSVTSTSTVTSVTSMTSVSAVTSVASTSAVTSTINTSPVNTSTTNTSAPLVTSQPSRRVEAAALPVTVESGVNIITDTTTLASQPEASPTTVTSASQSTVTSVSRTMATSVTSASRPPVTPVTSHRPVLSRPASLSLSMSSSLTVTGSSPSASRDKITSRTRHHILPPIHLPLTQHHCLTPTSITANHLASLPHPPMSAPPLRRGSHLSATAAFSFDFPLESRGGRLSGASQSQASQSPAPGCAVSAPLALPPVVQTTLLTPT